MPNYRWGSRRPLHQHSRRSHPLNLASLVGLASPPTHFAGTPPGDPSGVPACGSSPSMLASLVVDSNTRGRTPRVPWRQPVGIYSKYDSTMQLSPVTRGAIDLTPDRLPSRTRMIALFFTFLDTWIFRVATSESRSFLTSSATL